MYVNYIEKTKYPQENNTKTNSIRDQTAPDKRTPLNSTSSSVCNQGSCWRSSVWQAATGKKLLVRLVLYNSVIKINKTMQITRPTKTR